MAIFEFTATPRGKFNEIHESLLRDIKKKEKCRTAIDKLKSGNFVRLNEIRVALQFGQASCIIQRLHDRTATATMMKTYQLRHSPRYVRALYLQYST